MLVGVVAVAARVGVVIASGGFGGRAGYDSGVYYAASAALLNGRLPYRDFTLIHPPGIAMTLTPLAWIGQLTTDRCGFVLAMIVTTLVGATDALLVLLIARRAGLGRAGGVAGGLFYALAFPAVTTEFTVRLEPFGNLFVLLALLAVVSSTNPRPGLPAALCGASLAIATSFKIWYVVPLVVVVVWSLAEGYDRRFALTVLKGAGVAFLVVDGPFFAVAPRQMFQSVIVDQLGRARMNVPVATRLQTIIGLGGHRLPRPELGLALGAAALLAGALVALARDTRLGRLATVLLGAQLVTLLASPSFFDFYADYAMTGMALLIATARPSGRAAVIAGFVLVPATLSTVLFLGARPVHLLSPFPGRALQPVIANSACVQSDEPMTLIELNVLSRDLRNGCRVWVDVTGRTYGVDLRRDTAGRPLPRSLNQAWQHDVRCYLQSGDAVIVTRPATGLSVQTRHAISGGRLLGSARGLRVYATRAPASAVARAATCTVPRRG